MSDESLFPFGDDWLKPILFGIMSLYCALVPKNISANVIVDALKASVKPENV